MTVPSLTSLSIESLRGSITPFTLAFEKGRKLTIIYGENGTGKSTIADAFDLLGNGKVGSLDNRGVGTATRAYWPSLGKAHTDIKVVFSTSAGVCNLLIGTKNATVDANQLRPKVDVLRRSQILSLISAQPADRYKEIGRFIDVSGVEASENALRSLIRGKSAEQNTVATRVAENRAAIAGLWTQAGSPAQDAIGWAEHEVNSDQSNLDQLRLIADRLILLFDAVSPHPQKVIGFTNYLNTAEAEHASAKLALETIQGTVASDHLELLDLLRAAQVHFQKHPDPTICPLCESGEKALGLVEKVNRRVHSHGLHAQLEAARHLVASKFSAVTQARQRLEDAKVLAGVDARALEAYCKSGEVPAGVAIPAFPVAADLAQWNDWLLDNESLRPKWKAISESCVADKRFVAALKASYETLRSNEANAKETDTIVPRLRLALELTERERKKFTDGILSEISIRVGQLYEAIHPGEGQNKIVLAMDAAKRGSLNIVTNFSGTADAPPQAYFSDSHLDTLGLCVFLALAERDNPEAKILVLDDVLGSVDEPHVERIIAMIYDVSQAFRHAVVTTHYRPWREKFRWGFLKPDQVCNFFELNHWSFQNGITMSGAIIPEIVRLKTLFLDVNPDVQSITGKAGVILEALLDFLTLQYSCAVPRKHGNVYDLGSLLGAVNAKLLDALTIETLAGGQVSATIKLKPIIEEIRIIFQARNVLGAHFNPAAFDLYPTDGIRFAKLVEQLSDALVCPDYGRPLKDTGNHWKNGGDTRRLHPLRKPS